MAYRHEWGSTEDRQRAKRRRQPQTTTQYGTCPRCHRGDTVASIEAGTDLGCHRAAKAA